MFGSKTIAGDNRCRNRAPSGTQKCPLGIVKSNSDFGKDASRRARIKLVNRIVINAADSMGCKPQLLELSPNLYRKLLYDTLQYTMMYGEDNSNRMACASYVAAPTRGKGGNFSHTRKCISYMSMRRIPFFSASHTAGPTS